MVAVVMVEEVVGVEWKMEDAEVEEKDKENRTEDRPN